MQITPRTWISSACHRSGQDCRPGSSGLRVSRISLGCMSNGEHHAAAPGRHPYQIPFRSLETSVFVTSGASSGDSALWAAVGCRQAD
jgi:hypothetical protein